MIEYEFFLPGRFKPYVRMTQRSKWEDPQAIEYLASKKRLQWQMREQMLEHGWEMIPRGIPLGMMIGICPVLHSMDLDNQEKALLDAAKGVVFEDDRWVDLIAAVRRDMEKDGAFLLVRPLAENRSGNESNGNSRPILA